MTAQTASRSNAAMSGLLPAFGLAALIVLGEYLARHIIAPWLPVFGTARVNDMLVSALCYGAIVLVLASAAERTPGALWGALRQIGAAATTRLPWLGALGILAAIALLSPLDRLLWGQVELPSYWAEPLTATVLFPQAGPLLAAISLILVNGLVIPLCEERLWRGLIQPRLIGGLGFAPGLLLTGVLFSLKHVIIDASPARLLTLIGFGLVVGWIATRAGWKASAVTHIAVNMFSTIVSLIMMGR